MVLLSFLSFLEGEAVSLAFSSFSFEKVLFRWDGRVSILYFYGDWCFRLTFMIYFWISEFLLISSGVGAPILLKDWNGLLFPTREPSCFLPDGVPSSRILVIDRP